MNILKKLASITLTVEEATEEIKAKRLNICKRCKFYDSEFEICKKCGCFTDVKAGLDTNRNPKKAFRIEKTHCPEGMWPTIVDGQEINDKEIAEYYKNN